MVYFFWKTPPLPHKRLLHDFSELSPFLPGATYIQDRYKKMSRVSGPVGRSSDFYAYPIHGPFRIHPIRGHLVFQRLSSKTVKDDTSIDIVKQNIKRAHFAARLSGLLDETVTSIDMWRGSKRRVGYLLSPQGVMWSMLAVFVTKLAA